ncbi:sulfatase [Pontiella sulfatireligans]|uniref:Arylsulfatase n=1 Tax=Pontiella sulfatireligans TaxID=2750658 RepID=A0A6C2UFL9_9BACT|nr:sulfatase [Pontiella sulfatireligans]SPS74219.1 sulfatase S1_16 [Kiritimatiellales bacterium]VGO18673.1 Arylsulfatase [Pontiella sulfatireligans]
MKLLKTLIFSCIASVAIAASQTPNVVLILADDLGWNSPACFGSDYYESPNLDKLASQGMRFDNGYAADPICAPTRASLMSGWDIPRHGVLRVSDNHRNLKKYGKPKTRLIQPPHQSYLDEKVVTLAEAFQSQGYRTAMFGKWHLGRRDEDLPGERGFDEYKMRVDYNHFNTQLLPQGVNTDKQIPKNVYLTDYMCDLAVGFLKENATANQPFFLYLPDMLVHSKFEAIQKDIDYFEAKPKGNMHHDPVLAAMLKSLDRTVGRVMDTLEELGIADNTLLVFTSDNGGVPLKADGEWWHKFEPNTSNGILKGGKGAIDEGGIRVPYIFRFPGRIPAGTLSHEPIITQDLYPTLLAQVGLKNPDGHHLDGMDISAALSNPRKQLPKRALYWFHSNYSFAGRAGMAMRDGDWKLCTYFENEEEEMFNLVDDIAEEHNLVSKYPERAQKMRTKLDAWSKSVNAPPHLPNPDYKPKK